MKLTYNQAHMISHDAVNRVLKFSVCGRVSPKSQVLSKIHFILTLSSLMKTT